MIFRMVPCCLLCVVFSLCWGGGVSRWWCFDIAGAYAAQALPTDVDSASERLKSIQKAKDAHADKLQTIEGKKIELLEELTRLDSELNFIYNVLEQKRLAKESNLNLLQQIESEYNQKKTSAEALKKQIKIRLKAFWHNSQTGILNVLFSSRTFAELLSKDMYLRCLIQKDRALLNSYQKDMQQLRMTKKRLEQETDLLNQTEKDIKQQSIALAKKLEQKKKMLASLSSDEMRQRKMLEELEEAESRLRQMMASMVYGKTNRDTKETGASIASSAVLSHDTTMGQLSDPTTKKNPSANSTKLGFLSRKGRLSWPAVGRIFRPKGVSSRCLLIELPMGAEVKAVHEGEVVYSGILTGYGNSVIIDHGDGFYTMTAQCMRLLKKVNDKVLEGENICTSGSGPWIAEGIYFEIRNVNGQEDALAWLDLRYVKTFQGN